MPDIRKFPLFHALLPFVAGLLLEDLTHWSIAVTGGMLLGTVLIAFEVFRRKQLLARTSFHRSVFAYAVWLSFGLFVFSVNDFRRFPDGVGRFLREDVVLSGEVLEVKNGIGGRQQLLLQVEKAVSGEQTHACRGKVIVNVKDDVQTFFCGELIAVGGTFEPVSMLNNPGEFNAKAFYESRKVSGCLFTPSNAVVQTGERTSLNRLLTDWRDYLARNMEQELDGTFLAISKALVLGDKSDLDAETMNAFSTTGSMHVLAVSGLHIGLILVLLQQIFQLFGKWISKRQSIVIAIVLIWIYGGITGASPAVMRAVVMFSILSASQLLQRQVHPMNTLGFSAILLLAFDPWMLFDLGFQLSYAAMLGIFLLYRPIAEAWTPTNKWLQMGWEGTAVGFAATVLTTPLILYWFYQFPNYFALANIGVMLFGFAVLMMGMFFLFAGWIPYVVKIIAVLFAFSIFGLVIWVEWVDSLPGAVSGGFQLSGWQVLVAYLLIVAWILHLNRKTGRRIWLMTGTLLLIGWWTVDRSEILRSREWIVFNSNQFVAAIKTGNRVYGVYDRKWTGSWKVPRELEQYARYTGSSLKIIPLYHNETRMRVHGTEWKFLRREQGIRIHRNDRQWHYRLSGTPESTEPRSLMTTRLQLFLNPELPTGPFIEKF